MRRRVLFAALAASLGLAAGLAIVEIGLRLAGYANPVTSRRDEYCGTLRRPGVEYVQADEGRAFVRFNAAGFRDEEWTVEKPSQTFRIAVLGDSYVEAVQVAADDRFTAVLERELDGAAAVDGRRVQVLNFGVSGFGTAQELMCLRHHVWRYAPDLVIVAVTTGNDLRNNSKALQDDDGRPYFTYVDGELRLDLSFRESAAHRRTRRDALAQAMIDRSRAAQAAYRFWQNRASLARRAKVWRAARASRAGDEAGLDSWAYVDTTDPLQQEAWRITEGLLALMNDEVIARGARFMVMTVSNPIQVHPEDAVRTAYIRRLGVEDLFYPDRRIAAVGARKGFVVVNLAPALLEYATTRSAFLHGFGDRLGSGHWNELGHQVAGRRLAERVRLMLATPVRPPAIAEAGAL